MASAAELLRLLFAAQLFLILGLMVMNTYVLTRRPIVGHLREIYFVNSGRFKRAWYLVIAAMSVFLFIQGATVLVDRLTPWIEAAFLVAFATLVMWAFIEIVLVFDRYFPRLGSEDRSVEERIRFDLRRHLLDRDAGMLHGLLPSRADVYRGRARLGPTVGIGHYRGVVLGITRYLERRFGHLGDALLYAVGRQTARSVAAEMRSEGASDDEILRTFVDGLREGQVGLPAVLEVEGGIDIILEECALCCGMPSQGNPECHYLTGLFTGVYEILKDDLVDTREVRCGAAGDEVCEFHVRTLPA